MLQALLRKFLLDSIPRFNKTLTSPNKTNSTQPSPSMLTHAYNPIILEAEAGGLLQI